MTMPRVLKPILFLTLMFFAPAAVADVTCEGEWQSAALTNYESYPDPGQRGMRQVQRLQMGRTILRRAGQEDRGLGGTHEHRGGPSEALAPVGGKHLRLRQGGREIVVQVLDLCSDSDCAGCCTNNLGGDGYLIDIEKHTMQRFGSGSGVVKFQVCS